MVVSKLGMWACIMGQYSTTICFNDRAGSASTAGLHSIRSTSVYWHNVLCTQSCLVYRPNLCKSPEPQTTTLLATHWPFE